MVANAQVLGPINMGVRLSIFVQTEYTDGFKPYSLIGKLPGSVRSYRNVWKLYLGR